MGKGALVSGSLSWNIVIYFDQSYRKGVRTIARGECRAAYRESFIWVGHSVEDMHVEPALTVQGDDMLAEARGSIAVPDVREVVIGFEVALYGERLSNYQRSHDAESREAGGADLSAGRLGAC